MWLDLRRVAGWAAVGFLAGRVIWAPADAGHLMANLAAFMSKDITGTSHFVASI
jgi:hypothetical protein